jgi:AcrR family transcriptional regulator
MEIVSKPLVKSTGYHHGDLRRALVEAALLQPDLEGLSLRRLAAGVGVTPAAVYRHFEGREALLAELAAQGFERMHARFEAAFDLGVPPLDADEARKRLRRLGAAYLEFADAEPAMWRLVFGAQAAAYRSAAAPRGRANTADYLPAVLLGLHRTGVVATLPDAADQLFAWSAIHGAAALRLGQVSAALGPAAEVAAALALRIERGLQKQL